MTLSNRSAVTLSGGSTLSNAGTIRHIGAGALSLNGVGTTLDTIAGGIYDLQSTGPINCAGTTGAFNVEGTVRRSGGAGTVTIASNFNLNGVVDVQTGTLTLGPAGTSGGCRSI